MVAPPEHAALLTMMVLLLSPLALCAWSIAHAMQRPQRRAHATPPSIEIIRGRAAALSHQAELASALRCLGFK